MLRMELYLASLDEWTIHGCLRKGVKASQLKWLRGYVVVDPRCRTECRTWFFPGLHTQGSSGFSSHRVWSTSLRRGAKDDGVYISSGKWALRPTILRFKRLRLALGLEGRFCESYSQEPKAPPRQSNLGLSSVPNLAMIGSRTGANGGEASLKSRLLRSSCQLFKGQAINCEALSPSQKGWKLSQVLHSSTKEKNAT